MASILSLKEAVAEFVHDGDTVALEGFTHLIPFAAGHEIIRQKRRNLTLIRLTPDLIYDQMIGMGCASRSDFFLGWKSRRRLASIVFATPWKTGGRVLWRSRNTSTRAWPPPSAAGASNLPFGILRGYAGTELAEHTRVKFIECPFTGERLAAIPAIRPDVAIIHAQKADRKGNVWLWGVLGVQKEAVLAAKRAIVTVEEIVDELDAPMNSVILPHWVLTAVCEAPGGAFPSYALGLLSARQRFLQKVGWDFEGSRDVPRLDGTACFGNPGFRGLPAQSGRRY